MIRLSKALMGFAGLLTLATGLWAQPKLRLVTTTVGPVQFAVGGVPPAQTVEAYNAGSGALSLTFTSNVPWMQAAVGAQRACSNRAGNCIPINIAFQSTSLARGTYTGTLTVRDPNAIDAPQTISVTVQPGGGVPDRVSLYVPPNGGVEEFPFTAAGQLQTSVTAGGGDWLAVSLDGGGSFRFRWDYKIVARSQPTMGTGTYNGNITINGSPFPSDNRAVPVTLNVTTSPIAALATPTVAFRIPQGGGKQTQYGVLTNRGQGTLSVSGAAVSTASGGNWLVATTDGSGLVKLDADAGSLAIGSYTATVSVASNAANAPSSVPVTLDIVAAGPPEVSFGGVLNNATFARDEAVALGGITSVFGDQFTAPGAALSLASGAPLPTTLGGVRVLVNDRPAPIYFVSYNQINFQMPTDVATGDATVRVERDGQRGNAVSVGVVQRQPRVLIWPIAGSYGIAVNSDGTLPLPTGTNLGSFRGRPARAGDTLVIYAIGLGPTNPQVASGTAAPSGPLARVDGVTVVVGARGPFGGINIDPLFAGLSPGFVGLYQINVTLPQGIPTGDSIPVSLDVAGSASNIFRIAVQ